MRRSGVIRWALLPIALLASAGVAHAATPPAMTNLLGVGSNHAAPHVIGRLPASVGSGSHYIYGWDGTCPDGIDVYKVSGTTLTFVQNVSSVGCTTGTYFGSHHLAVVRTPSDCLEFTDGDGNVYSFTIDPGNGMLSTAPVSTAAVGGFPQDLAVSGSTVYESNSNDGNPAPTIDVLTVGSGCSLTLDSQNSTGREDDLDIALAGPSTVVSADFNSGDMVAYTLQANHTLAETTRDPGQLGAPWGVAAAKLGPDSLVFTGQIGNPPSTQGFDLSHSAFTPLKGSPQTTTDPYSDDGAAVAVSVPNHLLVQADQISSQIAWDTVTRRGLAYAGNLSLPIFGDYPTELTVAGDDLLVAEGFRGDVDACALAPTGVSDCRSVLTLTGGRDGDGGSTAIF